MSHVHARRGAVLLLIPVLALMLTAGARAEEILPQAAPPADAVSFAGMKEIPAGEVRMGIDVKAMVKLYGDPNKNPTRKHHKLLTEKERMIWWSLLLLETPEHDVELGPYALDVFTVTNAQYRQFLETSQKTSFFTRTKVNTIALVATEVYGEEQLDAWKPESIFWINEKKLLGGWEEIHKANEPRIVAILKEFNAFRPKKAWIKDFLLLPDKQRAEGWVQFLLPDGIALTVYNRPIPDHWLRPVPDDEQKKSKEYIPRVLLTKEMESWPVVMVTAEDADGFAEWAGKHLPTEHQYEKAARGPKGWLYPWGKTWDWSKERNFLVWRDADPEPKGPAAPFQNRPVDVTRCAKYASPYGMMHMLGNVREWTSSVPSLYPKTPGSFWVFHRVRLATFRWTISTMLEGIHSPTTSCMKSPTFFTTKSENVSVFLGVESPSGCSTSIFADGNSSRIRARSTVGFSSLPLPRRFDSDSSIALPRIRTRPTERSGWSKTTAHG